MALGAAPVTGTIKSALFSDQLVLTRPLKIRVSIPILSATSWILCPQSHQRNCSLECMSATSFISQRIPRPKPFSAVFLLSIARWTLWGLSNGFLAYLFCGTSPQLWLPSTSTSLALPQTLSRVLPIKPATSPQRGLHIVPGSQLIPSRHLLLLMTLLLKSVARTPIKASLVASVGCHLLHAQTLLRLTPSSHPTRINQHLAT